MSFDTRPLYRLADGVECACSNVHNVEGLKGRAGARLRIPNLKPGESLTVAELEGPAIITRLWLTFDWPGNAPYEGSMLRNRSMVLQITWDDAKTPAVSVPVGDFFGHPLCYDLPFENAFFGSPVGRSLLCFIPMPFRKRAKLRIVNEFHKPVKVFHDIRFVKGVEPDMDDGYFHACFTRTIPKSPGMTHEILPLVRGRGRYLGMHLGFITDQYNPLHWHGAHPKFYFDGDDEYPSLMGASLDDFGGASWAYDKRYMQQDSGFILSRTFSLGGGHYGMYFYHRRDPFYFSKSCAVSIQPLIDLSGERIVALLKEYPGIADRMALPDRTVQELAQRVKEGNDDWFECGRRDDLSSVALYYLDRPDGDHTLCSQDVRCTPAWQWPAADAHKFLDD